MHQGTVFGANRCMNIEGPVFLKEELLNKNQYPKIRDTVSFASENNNKQATLD